jgi:hypothetical protein
MREEGILEDHVSIRCNLEDYIKASDPDAVIAARHYRNRPCVTNIVTYTGSPACPLIFMMALYRIIDDRTDAVMVNNVGYPDDGDAIWDTRSLWL